ncbi:Acetamidase [Daldinia childiae]|uniref:Acetamidase n=1 Tax=Daldinia childiae TaxID=326645 RepID=UPI00144532ED|nr:Acetamidase [Daldinia childiae]KAF3070632.1 Acetamidase [Daldinia childiae]
MSMSTWDTLASNKRKSLLDSLAGLLVPEDQLPPDSQLEVINFPDQSSWFTDDERKITEATASDLLSKLASKELKSVAVTQAFIKRAVAAQQLVNCLSETCFDRALNRAKELDKYLDETGKTVGPLHGIPISLKDTFNLLGLDATVGFTSHIGDPAKYESILVDILIKAGAVVYLKTNVPTAMMIAETVNNIFVRTVNPRNRDLTSGSSSGGESALVVFKGSPWGVGTDIGGSLRIPAACTGIFSLRPSFGRFPTLRCRSGMPGQEAVPSVNGPLTRNLTDLELWCRTIVSAEPWNVDSRCLPIPWRTVTLPNKLKIAVMYNDGMVRPTPPVKRVLEETVSKLRAAGHEIVEWSPEDQSNGLDLLNSMFYADGGKSIRKELEHTGEPWRPELAPYENAREIGGYEYWQLHLERQDFQKKYLDRWVTAGIDAILCPTTPYSSVENGKYKHVAYTGVFNVVDYSCLSFPTGCVVDASIDLPYPPDVLPLSDLDKEIQSEYDPKIVDGMLVSLQLVANRLEEEKCIKMCQKVLEALG